MICLLAIILEAFSLIFFHILEKIVSTVKKTKNRTVAKNNADDFLIIIINLFFCKPDGKFSKNLTKFPNVYIRKQDI